MIEPEKKAEIDALVAARIKARTDKDFAEADRIRELIVSMGVTIMDGRDPETGEWITRWEIRDGSGSE